MNDGVTKDVVDHEVHRSVTRGESVRVDEIVNVMSGVIVIKIATRIAKGTEKGNVNGQNVVVDGIVRGVEVLKDENVVRNAKKIRNGIDEMMTATERKGDTKKMMIAIVEKKEVMTVIVVRSVLDVTIAARETKGKIVIEREIENETERTVTRIVKV